MKIYPVRLNIITYVSFAILQVVGINSVCLISRGFVGKIAREDREKYLRYLNEASQMTVTSFFAI